MIGYFTMFKRALHAAPRPEVLDNLRPMFKVFMEAFDVKMEFGFVEVSVSPFWVQRESCEINPWISTRANPM